jgi:hypothetical protein
LYLDCEIPEHFVALIHLKQFDAGDLFPIFGKVKQLEFGHKGHKHPRQETLTVDRYPVLDTSIPQPHKDLSYLLFGSDVFGVKVTQQAYLYSHMTAGEMSPGRRRGTLDSKSLSTAASLDCDGIVDFQITGWSEDEDDDGDGDKDCVDGVDSDGIRRCCGEQMWGVC